jgi:NAD(P)-dependent dehydrogenase (short-subunit alcohol dehydrogenase family)
MESHKVALVTGGSRGIGRAICLELAREGYALVINYREHLGAAEETSHMVAELGVPVEVCQGDLAERSHHDLIVDFTMERFGRIDLLVNNAGIAPAPRVDILETEEKSFDRVMRTNLRGPYFLTQRVAKEMIALVKSQAIDRPAIVNITSIRSYTPARDHGEYCISKAGLSMVTKLFAVRLAEYGIGVHEVSPGIIETDMSASEATREYYNKNLARGMMPINRWGQPEEVARAVGAIARGDFPYSTGGVLHVDGGWHLQYV